MIVRELFALFGVQVDDKSFDKAQNKLEGLVNGLQKAATILAGGLLAKGIVNGVQAVAAIGDRLDETSDRLGLTTDALQELEYAAKLSGIEGSQLATALDTVRRQAFAAGNGSEKAGLLFSKLGVSVRDSSGRLKTSDELFTSVADSLSKMGDETQKAALAAALFGRSGGTRFLAMIKEGAPGIEKMRKEAHALGGVMSRDLIEKSKEFSDQQDRFLLTWQGVKNSVFGPLLEVGTRAMEILGRLAGSFIQIVNNSNIAQSAFAVLGAGMLVYFRPAILTTLAWAAAFAAIVLVVDDIWTALKGGKSIIGDLAIEFDRWIEEVARADFSDAPWMQALQKAVQLLRWLQGKEAVEPVAAAPNRPSWMPEWLDGIGGRPSRQVLAEHMPERVIPDEVIGGGPAVRAFREQKVGAAVSSQMGIPNVNMSIDSGAIVVNGAGDPGSVASEVMSRIDDHWALMMTETLATAPRAP